MSPETPELNHTFIGILIIGISTAMVIELALWYRGDYIEHLWLRASFKSKPVGF